jgi:hypothetical protein
VLPGIQAHFIYPDGVVAHRLGRELGIPVITARSAGCARGGVRIGRAVGVRTLPLFIGLGRRERSSARVRALTLTGLLAKILRGVVALVLMAPLSLDRDERCALVAPLLGAVERRLAARQLRARRSLVTIFAPSGRPNILTSRPPPRRGGTQATRTKQ